MRGGGVRKKRRRRVCRYIGEGERWIVVFLGALLFGSWDKNKVSLEKL